MRHRAMPLIDSSEAAAFWAKINVGESDSCWEWTFARDKDGYGEHAVRRIHLRAPRIAYFLHYGVDPAELLVCHSCDNPPCCNPRHLFLGDNRANIVDSTLKGRQHPRSGDQHGLHLHPESVVRGEQQPTHKLTEVQANAIRQRYSTEHITQQALANEYGVTREAVSQIVRGNNWQHLIPTGEPKSISDLSRRGRSGERNNAAKLTTDDVIAIRVAYAQGGIKYSDLATRYGVSKATIAQIVRRHIWKHVT